MSFKYKKLLSLPFYTYQPTCSVYHIYQFCFGRGSDTVSCFQKVDSRDEISYNYTLCKQLNPERRKITRVLARIVFILSCMRWLNVILYSTVYVVVKSETQFFLFQQIMRIDLWDTEIAYKSGIGCKRQFQSSVSQDPAF